MNKLFEKKFEDIVENYVHKFCVNYKRLKTLPKGSGKSILFQKNGGGKFRRYIQIKYVSGRQYVLFNVQWSKLGRFPDELCIDPNIVRKAKNDLESLSSYEEVWLTGAELGWMDCAEMTLDTPDFLVAQHIYTEDAAKRYIDFTCDENVDTSEESFGELVRISGWDSLIACFGHDVISDSEIKRALGDLPSKTCKFISEFAVPYLDNVS